MSVANSDNNIDQNSLKECDWSKQYQIVNQKGNPI